MHIYFAPPPQSILVDLGWDLLSLLTLRLPVDETDLRWSLVDKIVEVRPLISHD